ncbi:unnamed protein product [Pleuronectes platessa]|uniref:Uncharacterized protein n=1 Tax=Pleuronectes platessa TaxID=8262 RepID=A0A9N7YIG3_PLEPL|nr:unnamed protein product [Pleuronectes platessa]
MLHRTDQQTAPESSPSCSGSFNTSWEQQSDHEEHSNILVKSKGLHNIYTVYGAPRARGSSPPKRCNSSLLPKTNGPCQACGNKYQPSADLMTAREVGETYPVSERAPAQNRKVSLARGKGESGSGGRT